jgi:hypothetical protein
MSIPAVIPAVNSFPSSSYDYRDSCSHRPVVNTRGRLHILSRPTPQIIPLHFLYEQTKARLLATSTTFQYDVGVLTVISWNRSDPSNSFITSKTSMRRHWHVFPSGCTPEPSSMGHGRLVHETRRPLTLSTLCHGVAGHSSWGLHSLWCLSR